MFLKANNYSQTMLLHITFTITIFGTVGSVRLKFLAYYHSFFDWHRTNGKVLMKDQKKKNHFLDKI